MEEHEKYGFVIADHSLLIIIMITFIGAFLRFYHLGSLPIDGDNSFHALAAKSISETGMPLMPSGKLYLRALPLLYFEAISVKIFGFTSWSLRLPNVLIGIMNIILVYSLAKSICNDKAIPLLTALFFSISPWAVTVSRMPRMYETLLMFVLLSWILFYKWYYLERSALIIPLILVSVITISLHKVAILPLICFITPLALERKLTKDTIISTGCFVILLNFWIYYERILHQIFDIIKAS